MSSASDFKKAIYLFKSKELDRREEIKEINLI
jgi:hypothetical protein